MQIKLLMLSFILIGCGKNPAITRISVPIKVNPAGAADVEVKAPETKTIELKIADKVTEKMVSGNQERLVKSTKQLSSAIENCVGPSKTIIQDSMLFAVSKSAEANKVTFLSMNPENTGKDILQVQRVSFDGNLVQLASSVRSANLNFSYLLALRNVGNVVALNCELASSTSPLCACGTPLTAHAMLQRCLPHVSPELMAKQVETDFVESCKTDPKIAISSLIGSPQFAKFD